MKHVTFHLFKCLCTKNLICKRPQNDFSQFFIVDIDPQSIPTNVIPNLFRNLLKIRSWIPMQSGFSMTIPIPLLYHYTTHHATPTGFCFLVHCFSTIITPLRGYCTTTPLYHSTTYHTPSPY